MTVVCGHSLWTAANTQHLTYSCSCIDDEEERRGEFAPAEEVRKYLCQYDERHCIHHLTVNTKLFSFFFYFLFYSASVRMATKKFESNTVR